MLIFVSKFHIMQPLQFVSWFSIKSMYYTLYILKFKILYRAIILIKVILRRRRGAVGHFGPFIQICFVIFLIFYFFVWRRMLLYFLFFLFFYCYLCYLCSIFVMYNFFFIHIVVSVSYYLNGTYFRAY